MQPERAEARCTVIEIGVTEIGIRPACFIILRPPELTARRPTGLLSTQVSL